MDRTVYLEGGAYRFRSRDDGVRLWIDGQLKLDEWKDQARRSTEWFRSISRGNHILQVEYYRGRGPRRLSWEKVHDGRMKSASQFGSLDPAAPQ